MSKLQGLYPALSSTCTYTKLYHPALKPPHQRLPLPRSRFQSSAPYPPDISSNHVFSSSYAILHGLTSSPCKLNRPCIAASKPLATGEIVPDNVPVKSGTVNMTSSGVTTGQPSNGVSASHSRSLPLFFFSLALLGCQNPHDGCARLIESRKHKRFSRSCILVPRITLRVTLSPRMNFIRSEISLRLKGSNSSSPRVRVEMRERCAPDVVAHCTTEVGRLLHLQQERIRVVSRARLLLSSWKEQESKTRERNS